MYYAKGMQQYQGYLSPVTPQPDSRLDANLVIWLPHLYFYRVDNKFLTPIIRILYLRRSWARIRLLTHSHTAHTNTILHLLALMHILVQGIQHHLSLTSKVKEIMWEAFYLQTMQKCNIKERRVQVALLVVDINTISRNRALDIVTPPSLLTRMSRLSYILAEHSNNSSWLSRKEILICLIWEEALSLK